MKRFVLCFVVLGLISGSVQMALPIPINLLTNQGFEAGNFTGWTVGGNSIQTDVATDGTGIPGADSPFPPNFQNVRSGSFAGNALVRDGIAPVERIILSQTISVLQNQNVDVGFWMGNDSNSAFGMQINDTHTQILIDGVGLLPSSFLTVNPGSTPADFLLLSGSFNTGSSTTITVAYAINGSGTSRVGVSFDDFFFTSEPIPEPSTYLLFAVGILGIIGMGYRRRKKAA